MRRQVPLVASLIMCFASLAFGQAAATISFTVS